MGKPGWWRKPLGVRARLLIIVLIPSVALLGMGLGAAGYLIKDGRKSKDWAEFARQTTAPAIAMIEAFQTERTASILVLAGDESASGALTAARKNSDSALAFLLTFGQGSRDTRPELIDDMAGFDQLYASMPMLRGGIDARAMPPEQVFDAFSMIIDTIVSGSLISATVAPDAAIAVDMVRAIPMLRAGEAMSKAHSISTTAMLTNRVTSTQLADFARNTGDARAELAYANTVLSGQRQEQLRTIVTGPAWQQFTAMADAFIRRGVTATDETTGSTSEETASGTASSTSARRNPQPSTAVLPLSIADWTSATTEIRSELFELWRGQSADSHRNAIAAGTARERDSLYGAIAITLLTLLAFSAALWMSNRLIRRMRRLREQTLVLADVQLPGTIRALAEGKPTDSDIEITALDFGTDELGQIADAVNRANSSAVTAAVAESKTRSGVNAVFLNIAHRSQVIVHRQLALLDVAERKEDDPDKLDVLFKLDHLATRTRRNAENLLILGDEQPGRRWRNPVPLIDVVRGAVAESLDYTRIQTGKLPELSIIGGAVTDVIHLIAELTDNATAFSPPQSRVNISAGHVGKGVAIEIIDQGLGMSSEVFAERNALLAEPPDFSVAALSGDARLGLFVVAKLSQRQGISVRLTESDYGGVKAIVLIPTSLIATDAELPAEEVPAAVPRELPRPAVTPQPVAAVAPEVADRAPITAHKPVLPRRRSTATESAAAPVPDPPRTRAPRQRSAEEARTLMSAIENGTKQGRANRVDTDHSTQESDRQEGTGDHLSSP
ncbi:signal transduction histidine kinase [Nocardia alba]|uniref:histidine kinase n=1 Tax=Nocardia alba TaxID=225051 RepID=A0A4R1G6Q2_9NOCA|nr:signal transduction histidine kinase [Nocardia alba]